MNKAFLVGVFLFLLHAGCVSRETVISTHVNPTDIYQDYAIFGNQKETKAYAFFRVGGSTGTTIELETPSKVELDGKAMTKVPPDFLKGINYTASAEGYRAFHEIIFIAPDGKSYRYNLTLEAIEFQPKSAVVLSRSQTNYISLNRIPLDSEEKVEIILTNEEFQTREKNKVSVDLPQNFDRMKNALVISPDVLRKFPVGAATLVMTTTKSLSLAQFSRVGGDFTANYEAAQIKIQIAN